ncbi:MAG: hypothetical protein AAGI24_06440 [Pseudomonadota bacterium]
MITVLKNALFLGLIIASIVSGRATFIEMTMGEGPRDSSAVLVGDALEVAFVANAVDGTVSIIDLSSHAVLHTLDIAPDGKRVGPARNLSQWFAQPRLEAAGGRNYAQDTDLSRDGTVLFVSRGFLGDVAAFDIASGALLWRAPVPGLRADHMAISRDGRRLYVAAMIRGGNKVQVLDSASGLRLGDFEAGQWPHDIHVSGDDRHIYVASLGNMQLPAAERSRAEDAYRITVADAESLDVVRHIASTRGIRPFAVTADEKTLYVQYSNAHSVTALRSLDGEALGTLALPMADGVTAADWDFEAPHHGLALTSDQRLLCIAGRASDYAAVVTTQPLALVATVPVGDAPSWSALDASGEHCLIANNRSDDVSVVSMLDLAEVARIRVGRAPKHITIGRVPAEIIASGAP